MVEAEAIEGRYSQAITTGSEGQRGSQVKPLTRAKGAEHALSAL